MCSGITLKVGELKLTLHAVYISPSNKLKLLKIKLSFMQSFYSLTEASTDAVLIQFPHFFLMNDAFIWGV